MKQRFLIFFFWGGGGGDGESTAVLGSQIPMWIQWTCMPSEGVQLLCMLPGPKHLAYALKGYK